MNKIALAALSFSLVAGSALAQAPAKVFTPAPVPGTGAPGVTPADRAGPIGADTSSPFAGSPVTLEPGAGQPSPIVSGGDSRQSAPSPNLGK